MSLKYLQLASTPSVQAAQTQYYGRARSIEQTGTTPDDQLGQDEVAFISERDSFYLATVSETGWPYIQHRGGPAGFLRVLDEGRTLAFADLGGNRQLLTTGNLSADHDRVALFLMDYPNRTRLKVNGHARVLDARERPDLADKLAQGFSSLSGWNDCFSFRWSLLTGTVLNTLRRATHWRRSRPTWRRLCARALPNWKRG